MVKYKIEHRQRDADWALRLTERVSKHPSSSVSDAALIWRLRESARALSVSDSTRPPEQPLVDALAVVDTAVRRRMGAWRAALEAPERLCGPVRQVRRLADELLDLTDPGAPIYAASRHRTMREWAAATSAKTCPDSDARIALRWLLEARVRIHAEHPPNIHFPSAFYRSLNALDDENCLLFASTRQQLAAAALLLSGAIVEMDAGDGKTLASAMAALVFAASGRSVHILTANDYLAARDCDDLAFTMESLGIAPGLVTAGMDSDERRLQYPRSIVFATAREVGFDYLRDNIARRPQTRVCPEFDVAIVDEADHLLIDQARTPLIIAEEAMSEYEENDAPQSLAIRMIEEQTSYVDALYSGLEAPGQVRESDEAALATILLAEGLTPRLTSTLERIGKSARDIRHTLLILNDDDYGRPLESDLLFAIDAANSTLRITERGWEFIADGPGSPTAAFEAAQTLSAHVVHNSDEDYVIAPDGLTLVDRLDGRPMPDHRYMNGLHEALEAKEGIEGRAHAAPVARTTIHALMSNYAAVAGLTGTAVEAADIFANDYGATTVRIPPTFAARRLDSDTRVFFDKGEYILALLGQVADWHRIGRPVLLTFGSVRESSEFSDVLERRGIRHHLLNASTPFRESEVVARAGDYGAVTVSTGMAGRGTDIIVAGDVDRRVAAKLGLPVSQVEDALGLMVIVASLPASPRAERQIRGRAARQGSPGASTMTLWINDPILAFTRQQTALFRMRESGRAWVEGPEVEELLRRVQSEAESQSRAIVEATADFAAIIETESRAHYSYREAFMGSEACRQNLDDDVAGWIERETAPLYDIRADYHDAFDSVAESLWDEYRIDIGSAETTSPAQAKDTLTLLVEDRLFQHRTRLGERRFILATADMYLDALDGLWPGHLAALQDIALSIAISAQSHAAALTQFAAQAQSARSELRHNAAGMALSFLLNSESVEPSLDFDENQAEPLPSELSQLIV